MGSDTWLDMARDVRKAANRLLMEERLRSCLSRAYYAAYSKVTHELATTPGISLPPGRDGPSHPGELGTGGIRRLIETSMPAMYKVDRVKVPEMVGRLHTLRIDADCRPSAVVTDRDARAAVSLMNTVFDAF